MIWIAACWPAVSGALKAALLIVVIACRVSYPAGPTNHAYATAAIADDRGSGNSVSAQRHGLRDVGAAHRGAAVQRIGVTVGRR